MLSTLDRAALDFGLESLEARRMLSVSASVNSSHVLVITGTKGNDTIIVNKISNGKVTVTGVSKQFSTGSSSGKFNKISVNAGNGNDFIQINNNVPYTSSTISGSNGKDTLTGGVGADSIDGDNDNDTLSGGGGGADLLRGDSGLDTANYSDRHDNLNISLDGQANDGASGEHDNVQTEEVITGSGNDTLTGSSGDDFLDGGAGKDSIDGGDGDDDIIGDPGEDTLLGGPGDDLIQARNNDLDHVSGGSNSGVGAGDLASVDSIDVPAVQTNAIQKAKALAAIQPDEPPTDSNPSDLDTTYGNSGFQNGPDLGWDSIDAAAVDSQGRIIFVGSKPGGDGYGEDMAVTRYTADGQLDTGFGYNGEAVIDFPTGTGYGFSDDFAHGVAIGSDDSIVVVGSTQIGTVFTVASTEQEQFAIAKLDNQGNLDDSFGDGGLQTVSMTIEGGEAFDGIARDVAIDNNGNIIVAGDRNREQQQVTFDAAADFDPANNFTFNGHPWTYGYSDTEFGSTTLYDTPKNSNSIDYWTASQKFSTSTFAPDVLHNGSGDTESPGINDGVLALEPGFYGEYSHVTFTAPTDGSYDVSGTFDNAINDGNATSDVHVLVNGESQFDGDVSGGAEGFDLSGLQLFAGDTVDFIAGYGSNGNFDGDSVSLDAQVTRTSAPDDTSFAVSRLTSDGQIDPFFAGGNGFGNIAVGNDATVGGVALQNLPDDFGQQRIVVGGTADGNFTVARFNADGTVDNNFGDSGGFTQTPLDFGAFLNDIAVDGDNNIYAVGTGFTETPEVGISGNVVPNGLPSGGSNAILAKYDSNGSFQTDVEENDNATSDGSSYNSVSVDSQGRILAAGTDGQDYYVGRYLASDLSFDTTFADGPVTYDLTPDETSLGSNDSAVVIKQLDDNSILVGGSSNVEDQFESDHLQTSALRLVGDQQTGNPFDIETFLTPEDFDNPPPELQQHLDELSQSALLIALSQPDENGDVTIHTNNSGGDKVTLTTVTAADGTVNIAVTINGITNFYDASTTNSITINTDGGADSIVADSSVKVKLIVNAGEGDDSITGGGGTNLLFGQGGNDKISGGAKGDWLDGGAGRDTVSGNDGNDIVIGGPSNDSLTGGNGEDILIGGNVSLDLDMTAVNSLLSEWTSSDSNTTRINNIRNGTGPNAPFFLRATGSDKTVSDDNAKDTMAGGSGRDWFFRKKTGSNADKLTDVLGSEEINNV